MRYSVVLSALSLTLFTLSAQAEVTVCKMGAAVRRVEVRYEAPDAARGCSVVYHKDSENPGNEQLLWQYKFDGSQCAVKAEEFVRKLGGWGWQCKAEEASAVAVLGTPRDLIKS